MEIFDAYVEDLIQQEKAKEKAKGAKSMTVVGGGREGEKKKGSSELQVDRQSVHSSSRICVIDSHRTTHWGRSVIPFSSSIFTHTHSTICTE